MRILFYAVIGAAAAVLFYQLFIPPIAGLADQGDFIRTIGRFGYGPRHRGTLKYVYVEPTYVRDPAYRAPEWEQANSEYLFVAAALLVNQLVSRDGMLDIRIVGLVHVVAFLGAFARLLSVTRRVRCYPLLWIGALLALTDVGYAVYWNSLYTEPASCIFFLLLLAETVEIGWKAQLSGPNACRWILWAALWVLAKSQNAPLGLLLGLFAFRLAFWSRSTQVRVAMAVGGCALLGCGAFDILTMPMGPRMSAAYDMVFSAILVESKDPRADLRVLGLDPDLARYAGTGAWTAGTVFPKLAASGVLGANVTIFTVERFYLRRPARLWRHLKAALPKITFVRPEWYGNFEPSAGVPPAALSQRFNLWSGFHEHVLPRFSKWIVLALAAWPPVALWIWIRERNQVRRRRVELFALLPLCCLTAMFASVFGDSYDFVKHMYLFNLLLDACMLCAAVACCQRLIKIGATASLKR